MTRTSVVLSLFALLSLSVPASGQSLLATRGLGYPQQPDDARASGLGGVSLGLPGPQINWFNPAEGVGLPAPGLLFGYQYDNYSAESADSPLSDGKTARFPLILAAFPAGERFSIQAGFGSFLDQRWRILEQDTLRLGVDTVAVIDWWESDGGVNRFRIGGGASVTPELSVGVALDLFTGSSRRTLGRSFPLEGRPACCTGQWNYSGVGYMTGIRWSPTADSGVSAAASFGGNLIGSPQDSLSARQEYDLPVMFNGGASGRIGSNALVGIGGSWTGWSNLDSQLSPEGGARDSWSASAGIEWDGLTFGERPIPIRLGARTEELPFLWDIANPDAFARERALSLGLGAILAGGAVGSDFSVEFGSRSGDDLDLDESFWRVGISVRVLGR